MRRSPREFIGSNTIAATLRHLQHDRRSVPRIHTLPPPLVVLLQPLATRALSLIEQIQALKLPALLAEPHLHATRLNMVALQMLHAHTIPLVVLFQKAQLLPAALHLAHRMQRDGVLTSRRALRKPLHDRPHQLIARQGLVRPVQRRGSQVLRGLGVGVVFHPPALGAQDVPRDVHHVRIAVHIRRVGAGFRPRTGRPVATRFGHVPRSPVAVRAVRAVRARRRVPLLLYLTH
mmetsp:Transcript_9191/g.24782  ORF Transcript_9191/g.24782 Transcript_9191/m.24782 type:complete len:233 (-) Transcript_9191:238-936(-)